ncbi:hypothetical protein [Streptomyces caeruleatus]|uniref:Uncharacterized protein n=1 Tax=Streptomyces caeruleatus TaxID=661399 RepID=A0A101TDM0_9ACTN|nr:hypothetical protein AQJ67_44110 [Streptomyces caeruleatus]
MLQIEQRRALRRFVAVHHVQNTPVRAALAAQLRQDPPRRPAFPEDLADHRLRRPLQPLGEDLVDPA